MDKDVHIEGQATTVSRLIDSLDLESLHAELERLNAQARHVRRLIAARESYQADMANLARADFDNACRVAPRRQSSIREAALEVLAVAREPMTANELRERLSERLGRTLERTSLSPILSKLAQAGALEKNDVGWFLPKK